MKKIFIMIITIICLTMTLNTVAFAAGSTMNLFKPLEVIYTLDNNTDGFASGVVKVKLPKDQLNVDTDISMYWANEDGKLADFAPLSKFKAKSTIVEYRIGDGIIIPENATKLMVYTSSNGVESTECFTVDLPQGSAFSDFGVPLYNFNVVSDTHVEKNINSPSGVNFKRMLEDVNSNQPDSRGIFVVGDAVDNGFVEEYENIMTMQNDVKSINPAFPNLYFAIGNHELGVGGKTPEQEAVLYNNFYKYAKYPDGRNVNSTFYDFWMEGYHFIFVGNDKLEYGVEATLSRESLAWLDKTIAKDYSENRPCFIFFHQSMKNTIAGSLAGQGWNGVHNESDLRELLAKYPSSIMFNGHSHWNMDSYKNIHIGDPKLPTILNTASVAYESSSYGNPNNAGHYGVPGSEGYSIYVYRDKIIIRGREYISGNYKPSAYYCIKYNNEKVYHQAKYNLNGGRNSAENPEFFEESSKIKLAFPVKPEYVFGGWFTENNFINKVTHLSGKNDIELFAKWVKKSNINHPNTDGIIIPVQPDNSDNSDSLEGNTDSTPPAKEKSGCSGSLKNSLLSGNLGVALLLGCLFSGFIMVRKKKIK